jgi:hypothetical protein
MSANSADELKSITTNASTYINAKAETESAKALYFRNYQREKREGIDKPLKKINDRLDSLEDLFNDKNTIEIKVQGETSDWSYTDIKSFINEVGEISKEKYNNYINSLIPKEKQKYNRLDKYNQILECLKW